MCQINPATPYNFAQESDTVKQMREQLKHEGLNMAKPQTLVIKDPQSEAVRKLMEKITLGQS